MKVYKDQWEESYYRKENNLLYPKEEVVKFLNRFVRKKENESKFIDKIDFSNTVRGLDLGCGTGRQTILLHEFGIESYGVDISEEAIQRAKSLAIQNHQSKLVDRFKIMNGYEIPFSDLFFDITICDSVLDSMEFNLAKQIMKEINRVTKKYAFLTLISGAGHSTAPEYKGEEVVKTSHEHGTIQSYFNRNKIKELVRDVSFKMVWEALITEERFHDKVKYSRYSLILEKK